jgi:hypothetical protein
MPSIQEISCSYCNGTMESITVPRFGRPHGIALIFIGVLLLAFVHVGGLLGIIVLPFGMVLLLAKKTVWCCLSCKAVVEQV